MYPQHPTNLITWRFQGKTYLQLTSSYLEINMGYTNIILTIWKTYDKNATVKLTDTYK